MTQAMRLKFPGAGCRGSLKRSRFRKGDRHLRSEGGGRAGERATPTCHQPESLRQIIGDRSKVQRIFYLVIHDPISFESPWANQHSRRVPFVTQVPIRVPLRMRNGPIQPFLFGFIVLLHKLTS